MDMEIYTFFLLLVKALGVVINCLYFSATQLSYSHYQLPVLQRHTAQLSLLDFYCSQLPVDRAPEFWPLRHGTIYSKVFV
jgi:hypothetical protein